MARSSPGSLLGPHSLFFIFHFNITSQRSANLTKTGRGLYWRGGCISLGGITNAVSLLWKYLLWPPNFVRIHTKPGRVWSVARALTVPGSHEGLFYRAWVMTGWYTEPCLIRNPLEARIMLSYLHDCQGTVKNSVKVKGGGVCL